MDLFEIKCLECGETLICIRATEKTDEGDIKLVFECSNPYCDACETWDIADYTE